MADKKLRIQILAVDDASRTLNQVGSNLNKLGSQSQKVKQAMNTLGKTMVSIGAASALAIVGITKAAVDWETAFAGVVKTVDATEAELKVLDRQLRDLAKEIPISATELAKVAEAAGQLGVAKKDITSFTKTMANLGVATNLTAEDAAIAFAQLANVMGEPIENMEQLGAALVDLGNNSATTEKDILNFAQRVSSSGKIANLTSQDLLGIGATFASVGVRAERGGTAVQKVLINLTEAVATGSDELETFAEVAGLSSKEFEKAWKDDAAGAFTLFVEGLGKSGDEVFTILDELGIADQRLIQAFVAVSNSGDLMRKSIDRANKAFKEGTALTIEAEKRYETTASQVQLFKNNMNELGIIMGGPFLTAINNLITGLTPLITKFAQFAEQHPRLLGGILVVITALGALSAAIMLLSPIFSALGVVIPVVVAGLATLGPALAASGVAAVVATGGLFALVGVLIALPALFMQSWNTSNQFRLNVIDLSLQVSDLVMKTSSLTAVMFGLDSAILGSTTSTMALNLAKKNLIITTDNLRNAEDNLRQSELNLEAAQLRVERQTKNLSEIIKLYGEDSLEAREATNQLEQAALDEETAMDNLAQDVENTKDKTLEYMQAQDKLEQATKNVKGPIDALKDSFSSLKGAIGGALSKLSNFISKAAGFDSGRHGMNARHGGNFRHGGLVPGGGNDPFPAVLHGGERVIPRTGTDVNQPAMGGEGVTINLTVNGDVNSMNTIDVMVEAVKDSIGRDNELAQLGVGV